jgi:hypothetical protein
MALLIGQHSGIPADAIERVRASGQNHVFELKSPVPTCIMYFTAAVEPDGSPDVCGLDARMATLAPKLEGRPVDHDTIARDSAATADSVKQARVSHAG